MNKIITKSQFNNLKLLRNAAKEQLKLLDEITKAAEDITGEKIEYGGFTFDYIYGQGRNLKETLKMLNIKVKNE